MGGVDAIASLGCFTFKYHSDVCKGDHCTINFLQINYAYETLSNMIASQFEKILFDNMEGLTKVGNDHFWEDWDEWISWEGAWPLDYIGPIDNVDLTLSTLVLSS